MHWKSVCLLVAVCLFVSSDAAKMSINLLTSQNDNCWKYCTEGDKFLQITHARLLQVDDKGKILGNILCDFGKNPSYKDQSCVHVGVVNKTATTFLMLSVRAKKAMMLSQVEYRYKESSMRLFEEGFLDVAKLSKQNFQHNQHIQIKKVYFDDFDIDQSYGSCHETDAYPGALIADHGLFVTEIDMGKKKSNVNINWKRMYFDPVGLGERIVTK